MKKPLIFFVFLFACVCCSSTPHFKSLTKVKGFSEVNGIVSLNPHEALVYGTLFAKPYELLGARSHIVKVDLKTRLSVKIFDSEGGILDLVVVNSNTIFALNREHIPKNGNTSREYSRRYTVYKSINGGNNWAPVYDFTDNLEQSLSYITFYNETHGWVIGLTGSYYTEDGGQNWVGVNKFTGNSLEKNIIPIGIDKVIFARANEIIVANEKLEPQRKWSLPDTYKISNVSLIDNNHIVLIADSKGQTNKEEMYSALVILEYDKLTPLFTYADLPEAHYFSRVRGVGDYLFLTGTDIKSAGFLGISHKGYLLNKKTKKLSRIRLPQLLQKPHFELIKDSQNGILVQKDDVGFNGPYKISTITL